MKANDSNNRRKNMMRKKVFRFRRTATVLLLLVATFVVIAMGSFKAVSYGGKIVWTQFRMAQCYSKIKDAEADRKYNLEMARTYPLAAAGYVAQAEQDDEKILHWEGIRSDLYNSDDPVIANAAKDGFDFHQLLIGILILLALIVCYVLGYWFRSKLFIVFMIEVKIFDSIMSGFFYVLRFVLVRLVRFSSAEFNFHNTNRQRTLAEHRKNVQRKDDDTVVSFKRKQRKHRKQWCKIG